MNCDGGRAFFNDEVISAGLRDHGVTPEDAHHYMNSTCVEIKVVGASNMWVTAPYFNLPQGLLEVMERVTKGDEAAPSCRPRQVTLLVFEFALSDSSN